MSITNVYGVGAVQVGSTVVPGISQVAIPTGITTTGQGRSGEVYRRFAAVSGIKPRPTFSTEAVAAALDLIGASGAAIETAGLTLWAQQHAAGGTRAGATSHRKYVVNEGLVVPRRLSVQSDGNASIDYEVFVCHDGTNAPLVITDSQTLPAAAADTTRFTVGPVEIGGETLTHVTGIEIDFGIEVESLSADGELYDTFAAIKSISPRITISGIDPLWLSAAVVPLTGLAATHANTLIMLRKRANTSTFVAEATAEHISFAAAGLLRVEQGLSASDRDAGTCSVVLECIYDGTNAPLVVDTTAAIE